MSTKAPVDFIVLTVACDGPGTMLQRSGQFYSRPPLVFREVSEEKALGRGWSPLGSTSGSTQTGIPLWWETRLVPEGWDLVRRTFATLHPDLLPKSTRINLRLQEYARHFDPDRKAILTIAAYLVARDIAYSVSTDGRAALAEATASLEPEVSRGDPE